MAATSLSEELSETYGQYQEEKSKADTASKFFASREELADELQEWLYSGGSLKAAPCCELVPNLPAPARPLRTYGSSWADEVLGTDAA